MNSRDFSQKAGLFWFKGITHGETLTTNKICPQTTDYALWRVF